jgi:carboxymethylenebutenolidase
MNEPGIVVTGLTAGAHETLARFAARGFRVATAGGEDVEGALERVRAAMMTLAADPACNGRIAVVGYGRGGAAAFLAVTRLGAAAGVAFHGVGIGEQLGESALVRVPLSFHFGDADASVPPAEVRAIKGALEGFATTDIYRYPGAGQGFALAGDPGYDAAAAELAERRAFDTLDRLR